MRAANQLVLPIVPRAERVTHAQSQTTVDGIAASLEGRRDVDQSQPHAVFDPGLGLPRVGEQETQGLVHRPHLRRDPRHQVHVQQVAPERRVGLGRRGDQHLESQRAVRARRVPVHLDPIDREARWIVAGLVEHAIVGARAFPMQLEVG